MNKVKSHLPPTLLILGALVRVIGYTRPAIWYDEAYSIGMSRLPLFDMLRLMTIDYNPPLWELILKPLTWFSTAAWVVRLPSLAASLGALWFTWLIIDGLDFTWQQKSMAAGFVALLPSQFWAAQDARIYAVFSLLIMAGLWAVIDFRPVWLIVVCALLPLAHNTGPLWVVGLVSLAWFQFWKTDVSVLGRSWKLANRKGAAIAASAGLLTWLLWFFPSVLPHLTSDGERFWLEPVTFGGVIYSTMTAIFVNSIPAAWQLWAGTLLLLSVFVGLVFSLGVLFAPIVNKAAGYFATARAGLELAGIPKGVAGVVRVPEINLDPDDRHTGWLLLFWAGPVLALLIISIAWIPVYFYRPLVPALTPFGIWLGAAIAPRKKLSSTNWIMPFWWTVILMAGVVYWNPELKGGDLDQAAALVARSWQDGDALFYGSGPVAAPFDYYLRDLNHAYIYDADLVTSLMHKDIQEAFGFSRASIEFLEQTHYKRIWYVLPGSGKIEPDIYNDMLTLSETGHIVDGVEYWQADDIEIYLIELE